MGIDKVADSAAILRAAVDQYQPTHIVSMVSGGTDSAACHAVAEEIGVKVNLIMHGRTGCGIKQTQDHVEAYYGAKSPELVIADAGNAYEDYVLRKGFFGKGIDAHGFAYRVLKATPFRKAISSNIRHGKRDVRVLLLNGARKDESENRKKRLQVTRQDPASPGNIWVNLIHNWTADDKAEYLESRAIPINPVAKALCRSGECMCGTMQTGLERAEAAAIYPEWGAWISRLEAEAKRLHGFGWGVTAPKKPDPRQIDMFQPMCSDCTKEAL